MTRGDRTTDEQVIVTLLETQRELTTTRMGRAGRRRQNPAGGMSWPIQRM